MLTVFVVPNNALNQNGGLIPIVGYATFYMAGWDHDPCIQKGTNPYPKPRTPGRRRNHLGVLHLLHHPRELQRAGR